MSRQETERGCIYYTWKIHAHWVKVVLIPSPSFLFLRCENDTNRLINSASRFAGQAACPGCARAREGKSFDVVEHDALLRSLTATLAILLPLSLDVWRIAIISRASCGYLCVEWQRGRPGQNGTSRQNGTVNFIVNYELKFFFLTISRILQFVQK